VCALAVLWVTTTVPVEALQVTEHVAAGGAMLCECLSHSSLHLPRVASAHMSLQSAVTM
jgi:hypothetical protein